MMGTNPYEPPQETETKAKPSTKWLRIFLGASFVMIGFPLLAEGVFGVFNGDPVMGTTMFLAGLLIVFAGWFCFRR